jgi:methyl halide transferase
MTDEPFRDVSGRPKRPLDASTWDARYRDDNTPWDLGHGALPLRHALTAGLVTPGRALVPGCGSGNDARLLAEFGFDVTGVDLSELALSRARALTEDAGHTIRFEQRNLLDLPDDYGPFDLVFEHTCFCAIAPDLRDLYVDAVADVLAPGGRLLGLFFVFEREEGPPFGASQAEIEHRFGRRFTVDQFGPAPDRHEERGDKEHLGLMTLREDA